MKRNILVVCLLFVVLISGAQNIRNEYLSENKDSIKAYFSKINKEQINKINGSHSSQIKEIFEKSHERNIIKLEDSVFLFNSEIHKHLNSILDEVYISNPEIDSKEFSFFINNSHSPNAACYGNGMFEVNLGLFNELETDDELAFVICHEIAHYVLEHSFKSIIKSVTDLNSKETKKKIRILKRKRYGRTRAAISVIDDLNTNFLNYSKEVEAEADSLGYIYYNKTKYNKSFAISALKKLKRVNNMSMPHNIKIDSIFNFDNYPFKKFWLEESVSIFNSNEVINDFSLNSDTISTHYGIDYRIKALNKEFNIDTSDNDVSYSSLKRIKTISHFKSVNYLIQKRFFDLAMYLIVEKFENNLITEEQYYSSMANILKEIYVTKKNHSFGKYVEPASSFSSEKELNKIRLFLNNTELKEIGEIGLNFCNTNINKVNDNRDFMEVLNYFKLNN